MDSEKLLEKKDIFLVAFCFLYFVLILKIFNVFLSTCDN